MRTRLFVFSIIFTLTAFAFSFCYATDKGFYVPDPEEEIYGTWVNTDYSGSAWEFGFQKIVLYRWGYFEMYTLAENEYSSVNGTTILVEKWIDSDGNIWYKEYRRWYYGERSDFSLTKISNDGNTLEWIYNHSDFPTEIDPAHPYYFLYYRQE